MFSSWFQSSGQPLKGDVESAQPAVPQIPIDIVRLILEHLLPPPRFGSRGIERMALLAELSLVSREWREYAQTELFRNLVISTKTQCLKLASVCWDPTSEFGDKKWWNYMKKQGRHLELSRLVKSVRIGYVPGGSIRPAGGMSRAVVPLLRCFTEMEELRLSSVTDYGPPLLLQDLAQANGLHTLIKCATTMAFTQEACLPNLRFFGTPLPCFASVLGDEARLNQYMGPEQAQYHLFLDGSLAPNLSPYSRFMGYYVELSRDTEPIAPIEANNAKPPTSSQGSSKLVVGKHSERSFKWLNGEVLPLPVESFALPTDVDQIERRAKLEWSKFKIICFKVSTFELYPTHLKHLANALDEYLPLSRDDQSRTSCLASLREIRIPSFETFGLPVRETHLRSQMEEIRNLRAVCCKGSRQVRVVIDDTLATGEFLNSVEMEEGLFQDSFWNGIRSLELLKLE